MCVYFLETAICIMKYKFIDQNSLTWLQRDKEDKLKEKKDTYKQTDREKNRQKQNLMLLQNKTQTICTLKNIKKLRISRAKLNLKQCCLIKPIKLV